MRILIYGLNYAPELTGIGKYTGEMAAWLAAGGHEVHVVTAPPYYPAWRVREDFRNRYAMESAPGRPTVFRCPLYVPGIPSGVKRMAHLVSFMLASIPVMAHQALWEPDVVFTVEPTFFCAPLALLIARMAHAPAWLHVQDFEVDAAFELGLLPARGRIHGIALWLERLFTSGFKCVSSISTRMVERSIARGVPADAAVLFPNWVDIEAIRPQPRDSLNSFRVDLKLNDKLIVLYSGNMGTKQGLEMLAPLAQAFEGNPAVHFLFCGDGAFRPQLELLVASRCNVTLLPLQPLGRLNDLLNAADIHLLPQRAGAADLVMPSRLTGMLASGRPIVATADRGTQVAQVVGGDDSHDPCGLVAAADDLGSLTSALTRLMEEPALRARLGAAGRRYAVDHLGREQVLGRFEQHLLAVVGSGAGRHA